MTPSRPRRPALRAERRARKRARILSAARALLRDHGHERLSLRHVARRARMSPAGMYEFFDHREHLIDTLAAEANDALVAALRAATVDTPDAVDRLVRVGLAYIRFAEEHPADFMLLFGRRSTRRSLADAVPENSEYSVISAALADVLAVGTPVGADPRVLEVLAYGFWSSIHGMAVMQLTHLAGFGADFAAAHRLLLEQTARSWQRAFATKVAGSAGDPASSAPPAGPPSEPPALEPRDPNPGPCRAGQDENPVISKKGDDDACHRMGS